MLLVGVDLVSDILATAPNVKVLVTSREALTLQEEWFHPIVGLPCPDKAIADIAVFEEYDAVRLFTQSARRVRVGFTLTEELASVMRICRKVDGMPLAIELAAAWLKILSCRQIADSIEENGEFLNATRLTSKADPPTHDHRHAQTEALVLDYSSSVNHTVPVHIFRGIVC